MTAEPALDAAVLATPVGPLAVIARDGVVVASGFGDLAGAVGRLDPGDAAHVRERTDLGLISRAVADYSAGDLTALDAVPVAQPGGDLMQRIWLELRGVRAGSTVSYSGLAARAERPTAVRLAGTACACIPTCTKRWIPGSHAITTTPPRGASSKPTVHRWGSCAP